MDNLIIFCAKDLIFLIALVALVFWLTQSKSQKIKMSLGVILGVVVAVILVKIAGKLYYHPRPFVVENIQPLVRHGVDNGFPSEHATFAALLAGSIYFFNKRLGLGLLVAAVLVGLGRIWADVHYPVDVIAGLATGSFTAWAGFWLAKNITAKKDRTPNNN